MSPLTYQNETAAEMAERFRMHIEATYPDLIVRYQHQSVEVFRYADDCECEDEGSDEFESDHSEEGEDGTLCSRSFLGRVCQHCEQSEDEEGEGPEWAPYSVPWPCPLIAELNAQSDVSVLNAAMSRPA
jgi:hypothetical protein